MVSFAPFKAAHTALENLNSVSEGILPDDLKTFLVTVGLKKLVLGVVEPKLAAAISETFPKVRVKIGLVVQEITRGIRTHFYKILKSLSAEAGMVNCYSYYCIVCTT